MSGIFLISWLVSVNDDVCDKRASAKATQASFIISPGVIFQEISLLGECDAESRGRRLMIFKGQLSTRRECLHFITSLSRSFDGILRMESKPKLDFR